MMCRIRSEHYFIPPDRICCREDEKAAGGILVRLGSTLLPLPHPLWRQQRGPLLGHLQLHHHHLLLGHLHLHPDHDHANSSPDLHHPTQIIFLAQLRFHSMAHPEPWLTLSLSTHFLASLFPIISSIQLCHIGHPDLTFPHLFIEDFVRYIAICLLLSNKFSLKFHFCIL